MSGVHGGLGQRLFGAGGLEQDAPLGVAIGIVDVDLHQEAVELRFRQRIGAFLLQRILRRQHMKRLRQIVARAGDRDVLFLHRLQQRGLGARAGAVDFVGHQELREHRSGNEAERSFAGIALVQHFGAENIRRHQVGRELDALGIEPERDAECFDQLGLGETGHADQQRVTAGQDRHQGIFNHPILAEDDGGDRILRGADLAGDLFGRADDHVLEFFNTVCAMPSAQSLLARNAADCVVMP